MSDQNRSQPLIENPKAPKSRFPIGQSTLLALAILVVLAIWMGSGEIVVGGSDTDKIPPIATANAAETLESSTKGETTQSTKKVKKLFTVRAKLFTSKPRSEILHIRARSEADISILVRAQTSGRVEKINGTKGQLIKQGEALCTLDEGARKATLAQAQALVVQTKSDYHAADKLARRGFSAKLNVNAKKAAFDSAMASVKKARIDLDYTLIKAPFTGLIEEQNAKSGDFLAIGSPCAKLVKLHPLLIVGEVSERNISKLEVGQKGQAQLTTGEKVSGIIRFISPSARVETRTFRVELEIDNKKRLIRNGVTADVFVPLKTTAGHQISPAYLSLNDAGEIGVRTIGENNIVHFLPVKILEQGKSGVWITGLPNEVTIIITGNDYVVDGQKVEVVMDKQTNPTSGSKPRTGQVDKSNKGASKT